MSFVYSNISNLERKYCIPFIRLLMILLIVPMSVNAQNNEFAHNLYHNLPYNELNDRITLGNFLYLDVEPSAFDFYGSRPEDSDALFSQTAVEELSYRDMMASPSVNYSILHNLDTGELFLYTPLDYENNRDPFLYGTADQDLEKYLDPNNVSVLVYNFSSPHLFFYNSMPDIYSFISGGIDRGELVVRDSQFYFGLTRESSSSQKVLDAYMASFKGSSLAVTPLVKIGLKTVSDIILIDDKRENVSAASGYQYTKASPSQFDTEKNIIYINKTDLSDYGYVVIAHELIQAGLIGSSSKGYLAAQDLVALNKIADAYFPDLSGYINVKKSFIEADNGSEVVGMEKMTLLSTYKAFSIGYTYQLLKQEYKKLPEKEQSFARKYFKDVESNRFISVVQADISIPGFMPLALFNPFTLYGSRADKADISEFLNAFTGNHHPVGQLVRSTVRKAHQAYSKETFKKILPSILLF